MTSKNTDIEECILFDMSSSTNISCYSTNTKIWQSSKQFMIKKGKTRKILYNWPPSLLHNIMLIQTFFQNKKKKKNTYKHEIFNYIVPHVLKISLIIFFINVLNNHPDHFIVLLHVQRPKPAWV